MAHVLLGKEGDEGAAAALLVKQVMDVVKYNEPSIVMKTDEDCPPTYIDLDSLETKRSGIGFPVMPKISGLIHPKQFSLDSIFSAKEMEFILDGMFPVKVWKDVGKIMGKSVATEPVDRSEIKNLKEEMSYKAIYLGVDRRPSKMKVLLNLKCLDELIRQDTLNCAERGMFIKEVRDYLGLQCKIYHRMMRDATHFCRKEVDKIQDDGTVKALEEERAMAVDELEELTKLLESKEIMYETLEREYKNQAQAAAAIRDDEVSDVRKCNMSLLSMLEAVNPDCHELPEIRETISQARKVINVINERASAS